MEEVTMENRAWRGVRLVSKPIREGQKEYVYTIGWHTSVGMFYLEEEVTDLSRKPVPVTSGSIIAYSKNVKPLIQHIEKLRGVKVKLTEDISAQEAYDIAEGEKILQKYPEWKAQPDKPVLT
jgi:hypothetical protein